MVECAVCSLRIKGAISFLTGEGGVFISDGRVDLDRCKSSTVRFESVLILVIAEMYPIVRINALEG